MKRIIFSAAALLALSGCSVYPFSASSRAPLAVPVPVQESSSASTTVQQPVLKMTAFGQGLREYQKGIDYELDSPADYFIADPKVLEVACDLAQGCPCIVDLGYDDQETFCRTIAPASRQGEFCVQQWSEGAAGSTYTTYVYTTAARGAADRCASLQFTKRSVTSCLVYEGNEENVKNCEAENAMIGAMVERTVSSLKIK